MPEICRFYGIVIKMFFNDHSPPHFHAEYGEHRALVGIHTQGVFAGSLPPRAQSLVVEWASLRQTELMDCWKRAQALEPIGKLDPLQ